MNNHTPRLVLPGETQAQTSQRKVRSTVENIEKRLGQVELLVFRFMTMNRRQRFMWALFGHLGVREWRLTDSSSQEKAANAN